MLMTTVMVAAFVYAGFLHLQLSKHHYDFSAFVTAGDVYVDSAAAPSDLRVIQDSAGYDGQFYYRLALAPFTDVRTDFGITLDQPAYRQQRIVYPLLGWLLSFGQPALAPAALMLVNFLALCALAWLGARYAQMIGLHAVGGLVFPLFPGFLLTLSRDTSEIVEIAFLLAAALCLRQHRSLLAGILLTLAVLTKETALLLPLGMLLTAPFMRQQPTSLKRWFPIAAPIIGYLLWQTWLQHTWGGLSINDMSFSTNLGLPFLGLSRFMQDIWETTGHLQTVWRIELLLIALFMLAVGWTLAQSKAAPYIKVAWLLSVALAFSLTQAVWVEDWAFLRVLSETYLFGVLILLEAKSALQRWVFGGAAFSWVFLGLDVVNMR